MLETDLLLIALLVFLIAGTVKGAVGIGLPTAAVGILSQVTDPRTAIALLIFPAILSNAWQVYRSGDVLRVVRTYWVILLCLSVVLAITTQVAAGIREELLLGIVGGAVVLFSVSSLLLSPPFLPDRYDRLGQAISGIGSGLLGGLTAIWSPTMVTYLIARRLDKDEFVRVSGVLILAGTIPLGWGYWSQGLFGGTLAWTSALLVLPTLLGFQCGAFIRQRIAADKFRTALLLVFLVMGLNIIRRAVF